MKKFIDYMFDLKLHAISLACCVIVMVILVAMMLDFNFIEEQYQYQYLDHMIFYLLNPLSNVFIMWITGVVLVRLELMMYGWYRKNAGSHELEDVKTLLGFSWVPYIGFTMGISVLLTPLFALIWKTIEIIIVTIMTVVGKVIELENKLLNIK